MSSRTDLSEVIHLDGEYGFRQLPLPEVRIALLVGFDAEGRPLVEYRGDRGLEAWPALAAGACGEVDIGSEVALLFVDGNPARPLIVGVVNRAEALAPPSADAESHHRLRARIDGERVVVVGDREIVLQCGEASITLTQAGKVLIRGTYISSRSEGANRISGGSVELN